MKAPIKTGDIVKDRRGTRYVVKEVTLTGGGVVMSVNPIKTTPVLFFGDDLELVDSNESDRRLKAIKGEI